MQGTIVSESSASVESSRYVTKNMPARVRTLWSMGGIETVTAPTVVARLLI